MSIARFFLINVLRSALLFLSLLKEEIRVLLVSTHAERGLVRWEFDHREAEVRRPTTSFELSILFY
jgi:hypothetical protein